jgi:hypothetical protein
MTHEIQSYQSKRREFLAKLGYKRLDITLSPRTWKKLLPHLQDYGVNTYPGAALANFLDDLEITDS